MSCCGRKRDLIRQRSVVARSGEKVRPNSAGPAPVQRGTVAFQYVGKTALTAIGRVSGRHYRFNYAGAIVETDARDKESLASVPNLRQIRTN
jgi:hypothetical protein